MPAAHQSLGRPAGQVVSTLPSSATRSQGRTYSEPDVVLIVTIGINLRMVDRNDVNGERPGIRCCRVDGELVSGVFLLPAEPDRRGRAARGQRLGYSLRNQLAGSSLNSHFVGCARKAWAGIVGGRFSRPG
jgi:hypothetical protein